MPTISDGLPRHRTGWLVLAWALVAAVVAGSLAPATSLPGLHVSDKLQHVAAYAAMAFAFAGALGNRRLAWILMGLLALGAGLEALQGLGAAGRDADPLDMLANAVGVVAGLVLAARIPGGWCRRVELMLASEHEA